MIRCWTIIRRVLGRHHHHGYHAVGHGHAHRAVRHIAAHKAATATIVCIVISSGGAFLPSSFGLPYLFTPPSGSIVRGGAETGVGVIVGQGQFGSGLAFTAAETPTPVPLNVPEPSTLVIFGTGLVALAAFRWRTR